MFSFKLIFDRFFKYLCFLGFYERWSNKFIKYRSSMLSYTKCFFSVLFLFQEIQERRVCISPLTALSHLGRPHL